MNSNNHVRNGKAPRRSQIAFWVIAGIAAYFLLVEHRQHVFIYLPFLLILLCPLMHIFHHGHGGHGHDAAAEPDAESRNAADAKRTPDHHQH